MGKRKFKAKRSITSLPKGLPVRSNTGKADNPFEIAHRAKRPKHNALNRPTAKSVAPSALARSIQLRQAAIQAARKASQSANTFHDKRIGEYNPLHSQDDKQIARLVRERSQRSKRNQKYRLDNDEEELLTHRGKTLNKLTAADHVILSDDDEDDDLGGLETDLHFGGGAQKASIYGHSVDMAEVYAQRKNDLDDIIMRRKIAKAERMESKQVQEERVETMDEQYRQLADLLQFRDKEKEIREYSDNKRKGTLTKEDEEYEEWNKELKTFQYAAKKVKATDRTKTPEEIAKEQADRLKVLESKRLARMNADFDDDSLEDISDAEDISNNKTAVAADNAEQLDHFDSEGEDREKLKPRFTPDGLVTIQKNGPIAETEKYKTDGEAEVEANEMDALLNLSVGTKIRANYRAHEHFDGHEAWYDGVISQVHRAGKVSYDITYDDGDFEEGVLPHNIRLPDQVVSTKTRSSNEENSLIVKRQKAKLRARSSIPFVFQVPTTLDALHGLIAEHATTGQDASMIIERIYKTNSVRIDHRNMERMQNFYDVLLRRFIAIGDAIYESGNGGEELGRYKQLDSLVNILYSMAQDAPESSAAVWSRRLGFLQNAHAKRLRDAELVLQDGEHSEMSSWPTVGVLLALRSVGHIFPVTDRRHNVMTPTMLFLAQMIGHTPVRSMYDLVIGVSCCGLLLEYSKQAQRLVPELSSFLSGVIRLYVPNAACTDGFVLPSLECAAGLETFGTLRVASSKSSCITSSQISLEKNAIESEEMKSGLLFAALHLTELTVNYLQDAFQPADHECFVCLAESLLSLQPKSKSCILSDALQRKVNSVATIIARSCQVVRKTPLRLRAGLSIRQKSIKSLAPRLEDPARYSLSKDKGKNATQAALDRTRREYKRERKTVARELRTDAAFFEAERRSEQNKKDAAARAKRQKAFSWMEAEQATMNQQVRQGGGLLSGGGIGAARLKAKTAKFGMKKGGKL